MDLKMQFGDMLKYKSPSQIARIATENWVKANSFCPNCGNDTLTQFVNNKPVADFHCINCFQQYELKSKKGILGNKITDGAYSTMINRIECEDNPNFFFLTYNTIDWHVKDFLIIPKYYFVSDIIEKRPPLATTARRAGWVGCNVLLNKIPSTGRIFLIKDSVEVNKSTVLKNWQKTAFLNEINPKAKGWILDVLNLLERIPGQVFKLEDVYKFTPELQLKYPNNNFIKDKIRQQLQVLRDKGFLDFLARGLYKKTIR